MNENIKGRVFVLGNDIDTDQIIPAQYLVYSLEKAGEREKYGEYALSGVPIAQAGLPEGNKPFVKSGENKSEYTIIVASKNFGCGSSREHAPAALEIAGCKAIVASSYARIFYRNAVDGGFLVPFESKEDITKHFHTGDEAEINYDEQTLTNLKTGNVFSLKGLGSVAEIIDAGGIFAYARKHGMIGESADVS